MAIMLMALTAILSVESGSINATARAKQMNVVAMLAKNTMVETEYKIEGKPFSEVKKEDQGTFEAPFQDYRWQTKISEIEFPSILGGGGKSGQGGDNGSQDETTAMFAKLITNFLSKALREVSVTILWKKGSSEQKFSVSTYWVDLNHEFQLSQ